MKKLLPKIILIGILLAGLALMLYPTVSDYWNSRHQTKAIVRYTESVAGLSEEENAQLLADARIYNEFLASGEQTYTLSAEQEEQYNNLLNPDGNGTMGYIEIPAIDCKLPIYHGTDAGVLQRYVGHLEWSSLPVGGEGTHTVLSGHRGLPSAKLFSNLDMLQVGDLFTLHILNEVLTYEVDQILVVLPEEVEALQIVDGMDYCTLMTCTPYGVNSHRLLVRGHRTANVEATDNSQVSEDRSIDPIEAAVIIAAIIIFVIVMILIIRKIRRKSL